ncbi:hypothetical protein B296_00046204 [Ensete ventricosum]|uniref:Uncharacterized protein n=1 Tax=Ensete ventricosum TaxID=4639 RepID=A0A426YN10_ENSVE|nr:hypothetical protein B296_00046204 [Ensete ventricosum]
MGDWVDAIKERWAGVLGAGRVTCGEEGERSSTGREKLRRKWTDNKAVVAVMGALQWTWKQEVKLTVWVSRCSVKRLAVCSEASCQKRSGFGYRSSQIRRSGQLSMG